MPTRWLPTLLGLLMITPLSTAQGETPRAAQVYAHRGASAHFPEHTLAAYARAIADGADAIEPDLVPTRDGYLVARHENEIGATTDVAAHPEYAARKRVREIDGQSVEGWFTEDFTLAELKHLRARERLPQWRGTRWDGQFQLVTLEEIVDFTAAMAASTGRSIALVPELKHPGYFRRHGLATEQRLLQVLQAHRYTRTAKVVIQSFEPDSLRRLHRLRPRDGHVELLQLLGSDGEPVPGERPVRTYGELMTPAGLRDIATYAEVIGPPTRRLMPLDSQGRLGAPTPLMADARRAGLQVRPYTFRPENGFLPPALRSSDDPAQRNEAASIAEIQAHLALGIDGFFTDDPALGRRAVDAMPR